MGNGFDADAKIFSFKFNKFVSDKISLKFRNSAKARSYSNG
jgi:hypothetical protein